MPGCPHDPKLCECVEHHQGLRAYAADTAAFDAALAKAKPPVRRLSVVTAGPPRPGCDSTMTCDCQACVLDRVTRGPRGASRQPWQPRPARHQRAA